jgi:hypothetical protein
MNAKCGVQRTPWHLHQGVLLLNKVTLIPPSTRVMLVIAIAVPIKALHLISPEFKVKYKSILEIEIITDFQIIFPHSSINVSCQVLVAHGCNPTYLGG